MSYTVPHGCSTLRVTRKFATPKERSDRISKLLPCVFGLLRWRRSPPLVPGQGYVLVHSERSGVEHRNVADIWLKIRCPFTRLRCRRTGRLKINVGRPFRSRPRPETVFIIKTNSYSARGIVDRQMASTAKIEPSRGFQHVQSGVRITIDENKEVWSDAYHTGRKSDPLQARFVDAPVCRLTSCRNRPMVSAIGRCVK